MSSIRDVLIKLARELLAEVIGRYNQLVQDVEQEATAKLRSFIGEVTGGVWVGKGADEFVNVVTSIVIPRVTQVSDTITTTSTNVQYARDVIEQADQQITNLIHSRLTDRFKFY